MIPYMVQTAVPNLSIRESTINFGNIAILGNSMQETLTIDNNSSFEATMILDLRERENELGAECLKVKLANEAESPLLKCFRQENIEIDN